MAKDKQQKRIPVLRFPGFSGEWEEKEWGDFLIQKNREVLKPSENYLAIGVRSHFKGTFQKNDSDPKKIAMDKLFLVKENDLIVNITFAWEGALAIAKKEDDGGLVSHRFPTYIFNTNYTNADYFKYIFPRERIKYELTNISPGGAGRNRVLKKEDFLKIKNYFPQKSEQKKIAEFLSAVDAWIENVEKQKEAWEDYKKGMMQKLFPAPGKTTPALRFPGFSGEWEEKRLGECLDYKQPTNYIVKSTKYDDSYNVPVLTAGKSFILGYTNEKDGIFSQDLPVVIFDDFTTTSQFVNFPFKVKSSAMKILKNKKGYDLSFIFNLMQTINYEIGGHGRHWISKYSKMHVVTPSHKEQKKIADFLTAIDDVITAKDEEIAKAREWKKGLMQKMFV